ncbi:MAG: hypothetical protein ACD_62C00557G0001 [uncultured bacterium]|nr:MAG: hypothetical protein ACD_62C00557G0001 [uncultured bacterium]
MIDQPLIVLGQAQGLKACDGLNPAHARGDTAFRQNAERTNLAGVMQMSPATEFSGDRTHLNHAHHVIVLVAKKSQGSLSHSLIVFEGLFSDGYVLQNHLVDFIFDGTQSIRTNGLKM